MVVSSMTGFARRAGDFDGRRWVWEAKSVNGRGLETRVRLPAGFDHLEASIRREAGQRLVRGNLSATLTLETASHAAALRLNEAALNDAIRFAKIVAERIACDPPRADGILALRGVLEADEGAARDEAAEAAFDAAVIGSFGECLDALAAMRASEGAALGAVLEAQIAEIERLAAAAHAHAEAQPAAMRDRIARQLGELLAHAPVADDRIAQEAAMLAVKADIREELDRIDAHVAAARALLAGREAAGRRLDFLGQEFNREANTLCSKAQDISLKRIGLDLKSVVDQFREQAQNVE
jgi:uncharacterized protein (TIGR00255 family)